MVRNRFAEQAPGIERIAVSGGDDADLTLRHYRRFRYRNAEEIRMDGPQSRRQRAQLDAFDSTLLDERDWILEVVVCVLRAIGSEDSSRRHRFAVNSFDNAEFVWSNLNQRHFAHDALE